MFIILRISWSCSCPWSFPLFSSPARHVWFCFVFLIQLFFYSVYNREGSLSGFSPHLDFCHLPPSFFLSFEPPSLSLPPIDTRLLSLRDSSIKTPAASPTKLTPLLHLHPSKHPSINHQQLKVQTRPWASPAPARFAPCCGNPEPRPMFCR